MVKKVEHLKYRMMERMESVYLKKEKKFYNFLLIVLAILSISVSGCVGTKSEKPDITENIESNIEKNDQFENANKEAAFEIRMLDVGQGLAVLIKQDNHYMLYDGGGRKYSSYVVSYLKKQKIESLDYMIASHYDEDHINGLIGVLNTTQIGRILTPDYTTDTKIFKSFKDMVRKNGAEEYHPAVNEEYMLGDALITVLGPERYDYEKDNNNSIVIRVEYGDYSCIISGDAEKEAENDMAQNDGDKLDADLYIVGHHGSSSSSSYQFLNSISPRCAFISVGKDNSYGHPAIDTIKALQEINCDIYRTDTQGEVIAYSNGKESWYSTTPSMENVSDEVAMDGESDTYILNTNTLKFHRTECKAVSKIKENHKEEYNGDKEYLIEKGYTPCGLCTP